MDWEAAVELGVGSPHAQAAHFEEASKWLERRLVAGRVARYRAAGQLSSAERLLLAAGHFQALRVLGEPAKVLPTAVFGRECFQPLGRARFVRVCCAAARCSRALGLLHGRSAALSAAKLAAWKVTFGRSLWHALHLESVIRDHDVLILGETGTGKELIAHAIQQGTLGGDGGHPAPSSALNAAAVPETLLESELFGHVKGAFTGAGNARGGRIRCAHRGSFFLDEVGDLRATTQVALLRVMETDEIYPLGSDEAHHVDVRYLAATHADLEHCVRRGSFRADLYERLAGNEIRLPPLRERPEDIVDIGRSFVERSVPPGSQAVDWGRVEQWLHGAAGAGRPWPGNVRQLQNNLRDVLLGLSPRTALSRAPGPPSPAAALRGLPPAVESGHASMAQVRSWYFRRVLAKAGGNLSATAKRLGVTRSTAHRWLSQRDELGGEG